MIDRIRHTIVLTLRRQYRLRRRGVDFASPRACATMPDGQKWAVLNRLQRIGTGRNSSAIDIFSAFELFKDVEQT